MKVMRIFTGADRRAAIEWREVPLASSAPLATGARPTSDVIPATGLFFRETAEGHVFAKHNAPRRQFIVVVSGVGEIELADGSRHGFAPGDVLFVENTEGEGHVTRTLQGPRNFAYVPVAAEFDISGWPLSK